MNIEEIECGFELKSHTAASCSLPLNIQALLGNGKVDQVAKPRPPLFVAIETLKEGRTALECLGYVTGVYEGGRTEGACGSDGRCIVWRCKPGGSVIRAHLGQV